MVAPLNSMIHNLKELDFELCSFTPRAVSVVIRRVFRLRSVRLSDNSCKFVEVANRVEFMAVLNHNYQLEEITINNSTVVLDVSQDTTCDQL